MRASTSAALFVAAAGFVAAQDDDLVLTTTVVVPEGTTTVYPSVSEESVEVSTVTLTASWDTVTVSEGLATTTAPVEEASASTDTVLVVPGEVTSWVRYWPELSSYTTITTTFYTSTPPNATGIEQPHPTAAAGRTSVGSSLAALVGFAVAGVLLL